MQYPSTITDLDIRSWETFQPYFDEIVAREVTAENQRQWLEDWSYLTRLTREAYSQIYVQKSLDTQDAEAKAAFLDLVNHVVPPLTKTHQVLKEKLLTLTIDDDDMVTMMRNLRDEADLFCEENIPVAQQLQTLGAQYDEITGGISAEFDGKRKNLNQLGTHLDSKDRAEREKAWHVIMNAWQEKRDDLNSLFLELLPLRAKMAHNAGESDYRSYAFRERKRFDYTPEDCFEFHDAIEEVVVPAAQRLLEKKRQKMGVDQLKPWDWVPDMGKFVDTSERDPLKPFHNQSDLVEHSLAMFENLDPQLGRYFGVMADSELLDLDTREGKALGGYCMGFPLRKKPYIFMNSTGSSKNVQTLLHEAGHAFHGFAAMETQPLVWQQRAPMEFNEVASMAMEMLASPYLTRDQGGFYSAAEAAQHRIQHLESEILFLPYMAIVDAFQHWLYTNVDQVKSAADLDAKWDELWQRYLPSIDWTGFEAIRMSGWHRKLHIFRVPFYYIEYGMAEIGSLQVWRNSLTDHGQALADYRSALKLGGTRPLPDLYQAAGAEFRFDVPMLEELFGLVEQSIESLEKEL